MTVKSNLLRVRDGQVRLDYLGSASWVGSESMQVKDIQTQSLFSPCASGLCMHYSAGT